MQASRVRSDEAGRFRFDRVRAGRYTIYAVAPAFITPGESRYGPQGRSINISDGEKVENFEIALTTGGIITGRILDSRGNPVVSHSVSCARLDGQGKYESLFLGSNGRMYATDDRGIYRVYGLPAGRYLISLGYEARPNSITVTSVRTYYPRTYHPDATSEAEAKPVEVNEGQETTGIDITLGGMKKNYDVSGRVSYADTTQPAVGVPVSFGVVNVQTRNIGAWGSTNEQTNSNGEFRMQNILPGKYAVFAQPPQSDNAFSESVQFEIADEDVIGLEIKLRRGSSINGIAVMEGVNDPAILARLTGIEFYVSLTSQELVPPSSGHAVVGSNGTFRIVGLRSGKARILLQPPARNLSIMRVERDGIRQPDGIEIGDAEQVNGVRVVLSSGTGAVRGSVRIIGGQIPDGIRVSARARHADSGQNVGTASQIDPRGLFRIDNLPPAEYEIFLSCSFTTEEPPAGFPELTKLLNNTKSRVVVGNDAEAQVELTVELNRKAGNQ